MVKVEIYTLAGCPSCSRAKALLDAKGVQYEEYPVDSEAVRETMIQRTGKRTMPQIIINGQAIGGYDALWELEQQKKLDLLLSQAAQPNSP